MSNLMDSLVRCHKSICCGNITLKNFLVPGQFWNVPVTVSSYDGLFGGQTRSDDYVIMVDHPQAPPRSFVGLKYDITWEFERRVCYYVGNRQAGKLAEVDTPNDPVIEGEYTDYKVPTLFSTDFKFTHFNASMC